MNELICNSYREDGEMSGMYLCVPEEEREGERINMVNYMELIRVHAFMWVRIDVEVETLIQLIWYFLASGNVSHAHEYHESEGGRLEKMLMLRIGK